MIKTITSNSLFKTLVLGGTISLFSTQVNAQISLTTLGAAHTEDFDGLANTGTTNALAIPGWVMNETGGGARDNELYAGDTGGSGTGDTYSYGTTATTERALGSLQSGTLLSTFGVSFTNNTGSNVNGLNISYVGEQWRLGTRNRFDTLRFQYSLNATSISDVAGTWTSVNALQFITPDTTLSPGARNGDLAQFQSALSATIGSISIPDGSTFFIRWVDINGSGSDDGLAIDNFSITPMFINNLSISDVTMNEGNSGTTPFDFVVQLTDPAGVGGVNFELTSADLTANQPGDYMQIPTTFGTIPQGTTSYTLTVPVYGDVAIESDETFSINVTNVVGATVTDAMAIGTIVNDDYITPIVTLDPSDLAICNGSTANFFAAASGTPTPTVQWQVSTNGGTNWNDMPGQTFTNLQFTAQFTDNGSIYRAIFSNGGADTTASAAIFVQPNYNLNQAASVCPGGDYTFPDGTTATNIVSQVVHVSNLVTVALGCDSVITTTVDLNPVYNVSENASVCIGGDFTYPDGTIHTNITADESYVSNLQTLLGCDSIVTTNLTVNSIFPQITANSGNIVVCGDVSADFGIVVNGTNNTYQWFYDEVGGSDFGLINGTYGESNFDTDTMTIQQLITNNYNGYYVYCEVTNEFGCMTRSDNDTIVANDLPVVDFDYLSDGMITNVCADMNDTLALSGGFPLGGTYSGPMVFSDTLHAYTLYNTSGAGNYEFSYTYTDLNTGCSNTAIDTLFIDWCMGINDQDNLSMNVNLFPNPAHNKLSVEFATEINSAKISLVNVIGQIVLTESINSRTSKVELNLSSIETGVYYLLIVNGAERTVKKVIVE